MVFVYLRTPPPKTDAVAASNPVEQTRRPSHHRSRTKRPLRRARRRRKRPEEDVRANPQQIVTEDHGQDCHRPRPANPDRAVAEWLAANGARVVVMPPGGFTNTNQLTTITKPADIPAAEFRVREISLTRFPTTESVLRLQYLEKLEFVLTKGPVDDDFSFVCRSAAACHIDLAGSEITDLALSY